MNEKNHENHAELEVYGDKGITSLNSPVPRWLKINYWLWIVVGVIWFFYFCNGSYGWLDRGYWFELQKAANTTFPTQNLDWPKSVDLQK